MTRHRWRSRTPRGAAVIVAVVFLWAAPNPARTPLYVPDVPPKAALITIWAPNEAGDVTVTGAPGAVPAGSAVSLFTLETGHVALAQAGLDGSFSAALFAPAATSILVRADPAGRATANLTRRRATELQPFVFGVVSPVPGTILRVPDPPAAGPTVPFVGASTTHFNNPNVSSLPAYVWQGSISSQTAEPGGTLRVPGSVLEVGDTFSVAGAVGPPVPAVASYTVTLPSGQVRSFNGRANKIGYYYRPQDDFTVTEAGVFEVQVQVDFDAVTSAGQVTQPFPTGDVLGTVNGQFSVYVVPRGSTVLGNNLARNQFLPAPAALQIGATSPTGMVTRAQVTTRMPGFVLEARDLPATGLTYQYDPVTLARDFPNLDVSLQGQPTAADLITISLYASGTLANGSPAHAARVVALHGTELLNLPVPASLPPLLDVTTDHAGYRLGETLVLNVHYAQGNDGQAVDAYVGLRRPDGGIESLRSAGGRFELVPTGMAPAATVTGALPRLEYSGPLAARTLTAADPVGTWTAFALLMRAGQSALDPANWLGVKTAPFAVGP